MINRIVDSYRCNEKMKYAWNYWQ